jgi:hypothetical protein
MNRLKLVIVTAGALVVGSSLGTVAAQARDFVFEGHSYCWYDDGWRGPGWYRCGFQLRRGLGWGGPSGWHGWGGRAEFRERSTTTGRGGAEFRERSGTSGRGGAEIRERSSTSGRGGAEIRSGTSGRGGGESRSGTTGRGGGEVRQQGGASRGGGNANAPSGGGEGRGGGGRDNR